jgi:hypothetical protein
MMHSEFSKKGNPGTYAEVNCFSSSKFWTTGGMGGAMRKEWMGIASDLA